MNSYIYICTYMRLKTYVFVNITHVGLWVVYTLIEVWDVCTYMIMGKQTFTTQATPLAYWSCEGKATHHNFQKRAALVGIRTQIVLLPILGNGLTN